MKIKILQIIGTQRWFMALRKLGSSPAGLTKEGLVQGMLVYLGKDWLGLQHTDIHNVTFYQGPLNLTGVSKCADYK